MQQLLQRWLVGAAALALACGLAVGGLRPVDPGATGSHPAGVEIADPGGGSGGGGV